MLVGVFLAGVEKSPCTNSLKIGGTSGSCAAGVKETAAARSEDLLKRRLRESFRAEQSIRSWLELIKSRPRIGKETSATWKLQEKLSEMPGNWKSSGTVPDVVK